MGVEGAVAPSCPGLWLRPACVSSALGASPSITAIPLNQPLLRLLSLRRSPRVEPCEESSVSPVHLVGSASGFLMQVHSCHRHVLHPRCFERWSPSMSFWSLDPLWRPSYCPHIFMQKLSSEGSPLFTSHRARAGISPDLRSLWPMEGGSVPWSCYQDSSPKVTGELRTFGSAACICL